MTSPYRGRQGLVLPGHINSATTVLRLDPEVDDDQRSSVASQLLLLIQNCRVSINILIWLVAWYSTISYASNKMTYIKIKFILHHFDLCVHE